MAELKPGGAGKATVTWHDDQEKGVTGLCMI
jgi:hypothetical protein